MIHISYLFFKNVFTVSYIYTTSTYWYLNPFETYRKSLIERKQFTYFNHLHYSSQADFCYWFMEHEADYLVKRESIAGGIMTIEPIGRFLIHHLKLAHPVRSCKVGVLLGLSVLGFILKERKEARKKVKMKCGEIKYLLICFLH